MISMKELLHGNTIADVPIEHQHNLQELQKAINYIRELWNEPMIVTSGYRTWQQHCKVYGRDNPPKGSQHLTGNAVDIADKDGRLKEWLKHMPTVLEQAGLYCEEVDGWVHFQRIAPRSGKRWFYP